MDITISAAPSSIKGTIKLPASKSISNRVLLIRAISNSYFKIINCSESNDSVVLQKMLNSESNILNAEDAGTSMRFMTALASSTFGEWIITGTERMKKRPIGLLVDALKKLGALIEYIENEGYPPIKIQGTKLKTCELNMEGNVSSQFISALLMLAPSILGGLKIQLKEPVYSVPYIEMTLSLMNYFGIEYTWKNNTIVIKEQAYKNRDFTVEPDWSAASYWYEIVAFAKQSEIILTGLKKRSIQGDCILAEIFEQLGVKTTSAKNGIKLTKIPVSVSFFEMNCSDFPDIVPALSVTLSMLKIPFMLTGLDSLRIKESDRILALQNELAKTGIRILSKNNSMEWDGTLYKSDSEIIFNTYDDHRIAMALAPVSLYFSDISIKNKNVVNKSYPSYWSDIEQSGFIIKR